MASDWKKNLSFLQPHLRLHAGGYLAAALFTLVSVIIGAQIPLLLGHGVDYVKSLGRGEPSVPPAYLQHIFSEPTAGTVLLGLAVSLVIITLIASVFWAVGRIIGSKLNQRVEYQLRNQFTDHLLQMPMSYFQSQKTGDMMSRATNDLRAIRQMLRSMLFGTVNPASTFIVTLAMMLRIDVPITLLALSPLPFAAAAMFYMVKKVDTLHEAKQKEFSHMTEHVQESYSGIRVIKSYVKERIQERRFGRVNRNVVRRNLDHARFDAWFNLGIELLFEIGILIVIVYGGYRVIQGAITLGNLVSLLVYVEMLVWPMIASGFILNSIQQGITSTRRIRQVIETEPGIKDEPNVNSDLGKMRGDIEFRNVTLRYAGADVDALKSINLHIPAGQTLGIVGHTGSGKSSLINLIPRLFEPTSGEIRIDDVPLQQWPLKTVRQNIGYVQQEHFLFSDSLAENIAFGLEQTDEQRIDEAIQVSRLANDLDQFPAGLETRIGERGLTLSGGQQQRSAIARAIIRHPAVLLLDDALSSVDTHTEEEILQRIEPLMKARTTLIVSHRISTVRLADRIIVMENGEIAQDGTHEGLLEQGGIYREMYDRQQLETELEDWA